MTDEDRPEPPEEPTAAWGTGFVPDSDDLRPFPEVGEEWVDEQIRELVKAARAKRDATTSVSPQPPRST